jgi:hypothetical protein
MSTPNINDFRARMTGGGARANQFTVILNTPAIGAAGIESSEATSFLVKAASLPGQTITEVPVNFRGRILYLAGDREFETWTTTIINDTDFRIRNGLESWMSGINDLETSVGAANVSQYTADLRVQQLDRDNVVLKQYILTNCWPTVIAPIELSYDTVSEVETFDVTWRYTSFSASGV